MIGRRRFQEHLYHDPVRREFGGESQIIPRNAAIDGYRAAVRSRLTEYVLSVVAPAYPEATLQLIETALTKLNTLPATPYATLAREVVAARVTDAWDRIIKLPAADRRKVEKGLADYVLFPGKRILTKRRKSKQMQS